MINHISKLISRLNNRETDLEMSLPNNTIISILDNLELKGFINYLYNPYTNKIFIFNNKIKNITVKSKPSRKVYVDKNPYKLSFGVFISKPKSFQKNQLLELLLYVE
jgi:hypothetical protein